MRSSHLLALWLGLLTLPSFEPVIAQTARAAPTESFVGRVAPGSWVRIRDGEGAREGRLLENGPTLRILRAEGDTLRVAIESVDSLWVRGRATGVGALVGLAVGAAPVVATCGQTLDECGLIPNGLVIMVAGAALGAIVGTAFPDWSLEWP